MSVGSLRSFLIVQTPNPYEVTVLFTDKSQLRTLIKDSNLSPHRLLDLHGMVQEAYRDLAGPLPKDHPWKEQAHTNSARMRTHVLESEGPFNTNHIETALLGLLAYTHGLGRLAEATPKYKAANPKASHGALAAAVFAEIGEITEKNTNPLWRVALYAITHRTDAKMPSIDAYPDPEYRHAAHELLGILCDIVMYDGVVPERIRAKLENREEKDRLRKANWTDAKRSEDPLLGLERGEILPKSQLERFTKREPLIRSEYESYETLMLETLSYVFKTVTPAYAELIVKAGGPSLVLGYLHKQLSSESAEQFQAIKRALMDWNQPLAVQILQGM